MQHISSMVLDTCLCLLAAQTLTLPEHEKVKLKYGQHNGMQHCKDVAKSDRACDAPQFRISQNAALRRPTGMRCKKKRAYLHAVGLGHVSSFKAILSSSHPYAMQATKLKTRLCVACCREEGGLMSIELRQK